MSIEPQVVQSLNPPIFDWIRNSEGENIAFIWYCHSTHRRRLGSRYKGDESGDASGFLLKSKGFTLGNRLRLKQLWPPQGGGTLYHHFTGEVHILDKANVIPNAARDGLEPSASQQKLEEGIKAYFDRLNRHGVLTLEINKVDSTMPALQQELGDIVSRFNRGDLDPHEMIDACQNYAEQLSERERLMTRPTRGSKAVRPWDWQKHSIDSLKSQINSLEKRARRFYQEAQRLIDNNASHAAQPQDTSKGNRHPRNGLATEFAPTTSS